MKIYPHLWFKSQAEEAMEFYRSVFKGSKVLGRTDAGGGAYRVPSVSPHARAFG